MTLNEEKLAKLKRADEHFDELYGVKGTPSRIVFEEHALNWYYSKILKDRRIELKITPTQLANKVGKKRIYIVILEKGETDIQLSTFLNISNALGLKLSLSV